MSIKFDYTFQLDGTIEIRLSASGYLQGGLWDEEQAPYGHQIHPGVMGNLHDHVINCESQLQLENADKRQNRFRYRGDGEFVYGCIARDGG